MRVYAQRFEDFITTLNACSYLRYCRLFAIQTFQTQGRGSWHMDEIGDIGRLFSILKLPLRTLQVQEGASSHGHRCVSQVETAAGQKTKCLHDLRN